MVGSDRYALLLYSNGTCRALYDLESDPEQRRNFIEGHPERAEDLIELFATFSAAQRRELLSFIDPAVQAGPVLPAGPEVAREVWKELQVLKEEPRTLGV